MAQVAPHLEGDPQEKETTGQNQADDTEQPGDHEGEDDAQHERGHDADQDHLAALIGGEAGGKRADDDRIVAGRSEEHTSELQSLMRSSYAFLCLKNKNHTQIRPSLKQIQQSLRYRQ